MKVSVEVHKIIICSIYSTVSFLLHAEVLMTLVRLSLVEEIIKVANLMCILFSVKHPQTFGES